MQVHDGNKRKWCPFAGRPGDLEEERKKKQTQNTQLVSVSSKVYESECWSYNWQRQKDLTLL